MKKLLMYCLLLITSPVLSNHIVGGELRMNGLGNNRFEISLIQYWDQNNLTIPVGNSGGNRDPSATLYIYNKRTRALMEQVTVDLTSSSNIEYQNKACATYRSLNTVVGVYHGTVVLSPQKYNEPDGYYLVWERCCRNSDINNIMEPGSSGMVFYLEFPPVITNNSSPEFTLPNGQYICNKKNFTMNMSATDADGDQLRYSLTTPLRGHTNTRQPNGNSSTKSDYPSVEWTPGTSLANVIPGSSPLSIDQNGMLRVNSDYIGLYVFAIQCEEFKNGKRIGVVRRDFQLLVIDCTDDAPEPPIIMQENKSVTEVSICPGTTTTLETSVDPDWYYQWQLNGLNIPGATHATIAVTDTGSYTVIKSYSKKCTRDTTSAAIRVYISALPEISISTAKDILCTDETTILTANTPLNTNELTYSWTLNNNSFAGNTPSVSINEPGLYQLLAENKNTGCIGHDTLTIPLEKIVISLPDSLTIMKGTDAELVPTINIDDTYLSFTWTSSNTLTGDPHTKNISVSPQEKTYYTVTVTSVNDCTTKRVVLVKVRDVMHIPSAFSPNNDGINDTFEIFNSKDQIQHIRIYNRWGQVIFSSQGYNLPWNGTFKNQLVPAGSYPYIIEADATSYKGEILVLR
ncbi:gliding motility-associated C-terminal domain-containing protein [Dyadobacter sp. CY312]|uniref:gliding motility-associated C-terminal domain-containing protein n=1 Tax=Dyadobacter sp. CY312 TaxID=2907303 RepID=UPI001F2FAA1C|nr:gliding motility-associated C-terminal domain-containing protein [Dyadobacter sp. CY312]MCE7039306.1 gliding motility-associated C-terminal domain-containing protein [Dyadobacter sp. CY312]